jgi:hypothetical protein
VTQGTFTGGGGDWAANRTPPPSRRVTLVGVTARVDRLRCARAFCRAALQRPGCEQGSRLRVACNAGSGHLRAWLLPFPLFFRPIGEPAAARYHWPHGERPSFPQREGGRGQGLTALSPSQLRPSQSLIALGAAAPRGRTPTLLPVRGRSARRQQAGVNSVIGSARQAPILAAVNLRHRRRRACRPTPWFHAPLRYR